MLALLLLACTPAESVTPAESPGPAAATPAPAKPAGPPPERRPAPKRLVAIGDLHADPPAAIAALKLAGLTDADGTWTGGDAWLVQTGDITDRGPDSKGVIDLLKRLGEEARAAGGEVVPLIGNHEVMNVLGDWRYVSEGDLAGYGGEADRKAAFALTGEEGKWIADRDAVAWVGDSVFVHGGVDARWARLGVQGINASIRAAMRGEGPPEILGDDGPLWNRSYLLGDPVVACAELGRALATLGAERMVVGHTTQKDGKIAERCGGQLWGIDTGISAHYGSHLSALEITGAAVKPLYAQ